MLTSKFLLLFTCFASVALGVATTLNSMGLMMIFCIWVLPLMFLFHIIAHLLITVGEASVSRRGGAWAIAADGVLMMMCLLRYDQGDSDRGWLGITRLCDTATGEQTWIYPSCAFQLLSLAFFAFLIVCWIMMLREWRRQVSAERLQCAHCGYPRTGRPICPECGQSHAALSRRQ